MKILLGSHYFSPSSGGIETVSKLLAGEFAKRGHEVRVITQTAGNDNFPFAVIRRPGALELLRQVRWCDVFLQNNISLRTLWPLIFVRRPLFITHQTWITRPDGSTGWQHRLKRSLLRYATSFAISRAVAESLPGPSIRVGNPYDADVFNNFAVEAHRRELIFVGRLVSDKGVDLLLEALKLTAAKPHLTIVGEGPERAALEKQAAELQVQSQVEFVGRQQGAQLAKLLQQHQILVVPSIWQEPFGIVALEGIACGCVVIGSAGGGLVDAIGPCGVTFPNGDAASLAAEITKMLGDPDKRSRLRQEAQSHLAHFTLQHIACIYLSEMETALR